MQATIKKYCIMTVDLKKVEVGLSRAYHFEPIANVFNGKCKSPIKLFNSFQVAKSSFLMSFRNISWDDNLQCFVSDYQYDSSYLKPEYVIREIDVTYDINLDDAKL